jgi:predicted AlkP superfamily phosphohydrolase/phosphomutase
MLAFALPAFHVGQIRINLQGRERKGVVPSARYELVCEEIIQILKDCRNPFNGEPAVENIEWPCRHNALGLAATRADMYVAWKENILCLEHPNLGRIGPVPFRRTGGHTGHYGMAYLKSDVLAQGDYGTRSSFDVVPTLFDLLNERLPDKISGQSLFAGIQRIEGQAGERKPDRSVIDAYP